MRIKARYVVFLSLCLIVLVASFFSWMSPVATAIREGRRINGMLIGTDWVDYAQHSDTLIFFSYEPKTRFLDIISIPRDTRVVLPEITVRRINQVYAYYYKKHKNHARASDAFLKVINTVVFENRVEIKYFFQLDYKMFEKFVDMIGKVRIEIESPMHYDDNAGGLHIHFSTGVHYLDGKKALEYVRYRGAAGDIGRIYRQQRFMKAIAINMSKPFFILSIPNLVALLSIKMHTNLSFWDMLNMLTELRYIRVDNIRMAQLPGRVGGPYWYINRAEVEHALDTVLGPEKLSDADKLPTVEVLNASSHDGAALRVTRKLRDINFDVIDFRNYPTRQQKTIVIDRVGNLRAAQKIAEFLNTGEIFTRYDIKRMVDITVIIGEEYQE